MTNRVKAMVLAICVAAMLPIGAMAQQPSIDSLLNHIRELSSSKYAGRLAGTSEYMDAAEYVVGELEQYGVRPYRGDWAQYFETECNQIENCTFNSYVNDNDAHQVYVLGRDFCCVGMTGRGYANAPVVFCGYGIDNGAYDEYEHVDAKGKIVMVLSGVPNFLPSDVADQYRWARDKARVAQRHGACGLVVVNMASNCAKDEVQGTVYSGELPHLATFPMLHVTQACAGKLLANEKMTLSEAVQAIQNKQQPQSFHLRKKYEIEVNAQYHPAALTTNIIGIYPGTDKNMAEEFIVVGAQLDGVGMQGTTCLFPGADDNAASVAAMIEVARMLSESEDQPSRSVLFVCFSSGEQQHLGSRIFVSNFTPLKGIEAYVDVNSIGMGDSIRVLGNKRFPDLWNVARKVDTLYGTNAMVTSEKTMPKGEALAFEHVGIPSINFTHLNGGRHVRVPSDIVENIDRNYLVKATQLLFETVLDLSFGEYQGRSNASKRVKFTK